MERKQLEELLYQSLETERGGVRIYEKAVQCAQNDDLKKEWGEYLEQTRNHEVDHAPCPRRLRPQLRERDARSGNHPHEGTDAGRCHGRRQGEIPSPHSSLPRSAWWRRRARIT